MALQIHELILVVAHRPRKVMIQWSETFPVFFAIKPTWWHGYGSKNESKMIQKQPNGSKWMVSCGKTRPSRSVGPMNVQWYLSWTIANIARWASKGTHLAPASTERNQLKTLISIDIPCSVVDFQSSVLFQKDGLKKSSNWAWFNEVSQFLKIKNPENTRRMTFIPALFQLELPQLTVMQDVLHKFGRFD